jgi:hypothetical protein
VESRNAQGVQLAHGQQHVEIDHVSKGSQEYKMQMGIYIKNDN